MYDFPFWSPLYLTLTVVYFLVASIVTFDIRLNQAKRSGQDFGSLPSWVAVLYWLQWLVWLALALLNWKLALLVLVLKFVLKVLPVLETIGNLLMFPFRPKNDIGISPDVQEVLRRLDKEQAWKKSFEELDKLENYEIRFSSTGEVDLRGTDRLVEPNSTVSENYPNDEVDFDFISIIRDEDYKDIPIEDAREILDKFGKYDDGSIPTVRGLSFSDDEKE